MAVAGSRHDVRVHRVGRAEGQVPSSWCGRVRGPVGPARLQVHEGVRGSGVLAGGELLQDGGRGADAGRVAVGRHDPRAGRRRSDPRGRSARRAAADRDRRDLASQGPAVPHRRCRPSHRPARVGRARPRQQDGACVLRRTRRRALQTDRIDLGGHGRLDLRSDRRASPRRGPVRGPVPRRDAHHRRARRGPPRGVERGTPPRQPRARPRAERRPIRGLEEPGEPHRPPGREARHDPADQRQALPRVPAQRATPADLPAPRPRSRTAARQLARVGAPIPTTVVRQARPHDHRAVRRDPRGDPSRTLQRVPFILHLLVCLWS